MMLLHQQGLTNVKIYCHDAIEILEQKLLMTACRLFICFS